MEINNSYDVCIVGGGLAGLSLSILLAKNDVKVICFEKEQYPFHRVCGEYISLESWNFLQKLGLDLNSMDLPQIKKLKISSPSGKLLSTTLDLGGFGISRFKLDHHLSILSRKYGVKLIENTKVNDIQFKNGLFEISIQDEIIHSKIAIASIGKRSNLDIKWSRPFIYKNQSRLNNYVGIKYHINSVFPDDTIALHNFKNGYCGISKIEDNKYCLCYLTTAKNLKQSGNSIEKMEKTILSQNPHLKQVFESSTKIFTQPLAISKISFDKKELIVNHIVMIGDAAGMITPLCGNGMSMAFRSADLIYDLIKKYLCGAISRNQFESEYISKWSKEFSFRLKVGRLIQKLFGKKVITNIFISLIKIFPWICRSIIKTTHGKPF